MFGSFVTALSGLTARADFIGLRDNFFRPLFGGPFDDMLFFVVHRLGDSRKSAREVALRGSSVLPQDFRGPQMGSQSGRSIRVNSYA